MADLQNLKNIQTLRCPYCKKEIELTSAISHQVKEVLLSEKRKIWNLALEKARKQVKEEASKEAKLELEDLKKQLWEEKKKRQEAQKMELELRRQQRKLEEEKKEFELKLQREIDKQRKIVEEQAYKRAFAEYSLREKETEKKLKDALKANEELRRKLQQGSQQLQGEILELELEEILKKEFVYDKIEEVPKGIRGADVIQKVYDKFGRYCGSIIWESKRTKAWQDSWIEKLKSDKRAVKANVAALVSEVLPKGVNNLAVKNGVWVCSFSAVVGLATALRFNLIQLFAAKQAGINKNEKMEVLYRYLTGVEFSQKIEAIVESFSNMKEDLEREKRAYTKLWAKREKQLQTMITSVVSIRGDLEGIIGGQLPEVKNLQLLPEKKE